MKKILHSSKLMLLIIFFAAISTSNAAPGDTTWVQANNIAKLDHYGAFDTLVNFPNGNISYSKIVMIYELGQYNCPSGSQYCHQWDYTVRNYVLTNTDTLELGRLITPYATSGSPRYGTTWKQYYYFDVTDYYNQLKNAATIQTFYSGYSWGFSCKIKFAFIEGTRERDVLGVSSLWRGYFNYGDDNKPIDDTLIQKTVTPPTGTTSAELKLIITGHGSDNTTQCCEFNTVDEGHNYYLKLNGTQIAVKNIWRNDCGSNQWYPQGGSWIFNRANWCPGNDVEPITHKLPNVAAGISFNVDLDFDSYSAVPGQYGFGGFDIGSHIFYYGNSNKTNDAEITSIISPTNDNNYFRENPGYEPVVKVRNTSSNIIYNIKFEYNVKDSIPKTCVWNGFLAAYASTEVKLCPLNTLIRMSLDSILTPQEFQIKILEVNGVADADVTNNSKKSFFNLAPKFPNKIVVGMKTNTQGIQGVGQGFSETTWKITDMNGNIVKERKDCALSTQYTDTVMLNNLASGMYKLTITDLSCDGLRWWLWLQNPQYGITAGNFTVKKLGSTSNIPMKGYYYTGGSQHDFGCEFEQYFTTEGATAFVPSAKNFVTSIEESTTSTKQLLKLYPNPTNGNVYLTIDDDAVNGVIEIYSITGNLVHSINVNQTTTAVNTANLSSGLYNVIYRNALNVVAQKRMVVTK